MRKVFALLVGLTLLAPAAIAAPRASKIDPLLAGLRAPADVLIRFKDTVRAEDAGLLSSAGATGKMQFSVVPAVAATVTPRALKRLARSRRVEYIEADRVLPLTLDRAGAVTRAKDVWTSDAVVNAQLRKDDTVQTGTLRHGGFTGRGVGVAVIDCGVDATHPDLRHRIIGEATQTPVKTLVNMKVVGNPLPAEAQPSEIPPAPILMQDVLDSDTTCGHGTHVAGDAVGSGEASNGRYRGSAPGANLIGFGAGEGAGVVVSLAVASMDWIHQHHAAYNIRVVTNSYGNQGDYNPLSSLAQAARTLVEHDNISVVWAAGNNGGNGDVISTVSESNIPGVISVANYDDRTSWAHITSSRGRRTLPRTWPDIAAPGTNIISTAASGRPITVYGTAQDYALSVPDNKPDPLVVPVPIPGVVAAEPVAVVGPYASSTGTSMAAPVLAGVVALLYEANPKLTPGQVSAILRSTANMPAGASHAGDGFAIGAGLVDAAEAVAIALRLADGLPADTASVRFGEPTMLNGSVGPHIRVEAKPAGGGLQVKGILSGGPPFDDSIPLASGTHRGQAPVRQPIAGAVRFADDFETGAPGWTVRQETADPIGTLTSWSLADVSENTSWAGANSGSHTWFAGEPLTGGAGAPIAYTPGANVSLISPPIDLTGVTSATLSFAVAGQADSAGDALIVEAAPAGTDDWTAVDRYTGALLPDLVFGFWTTLPVDISAFAGRDIQVRFRFTSDGVDTFTLNPADAIGLYVDDVMISASGAADGALLAVLSPNIAAGVGELDTEWSFGSIPDADSYTLDFGDGSALMEATAPGTATHRYAAGQYLATLTVRRGGATDMRGVPIDVARIGRIEVRAGARPWQDLGPADPADVVRFQAIIDGAAGDLVSARYCDANRRCVTFSTKP